MPQPMPRQNAMTGISFKLASVCVFVGMATLLKVGTDAWVISGAGLS